MMNNKKSNSNCQSVINTHKKRKGIYFGTGLASMKEPSIGLGLGTLGMILTAAIEGQKLDTNNILHEIGIGYNLTEEERKRLVDEQLAIYTRLSDGLAKLKMQNGGRINLDHSIWTPEYLATPVYKETLQNVKAKLKASFEGIPNYDTLKKYTAIQTAGVKLAADNGAISKIGWTPKGTTHDLAKVSIADMIANGKINEYYFDTVLKHCYPNLQLNTRYIAGDIDWETGYRKSPYTVTASETRPLVNVSIREYWAEKIGLRKRGEALADISKKVVVPYEELYGAISSRKNGEEQAIDKIAEIQNQILGI